VCREETQYEEISIPPVLAGIQHAQRYLCQQLEGHEAFLERSIEYDSMPPPDRSLLQDELAVVRREIEFCRVEASNLAGPETLDRVVDSIQPPQRIQTARRAEVDASVQATQGTSAASEQNGESDDTPSRAVVHNVLLGRLDDMRRCYGALRPNIIATIGVSSDGLVRSVQLTGYSENTPIGECIVNILFSVRFPPFRRPTLNIEFPVSERSEQSW
jgi:hypothetical protein